MIDKEDLCSKHIINENVKVFFYQEEVAGKAI